MGADATSPPCAALLVRALCQAMAGDSRDLCGVVNRLVIYSLFSLIRSFICSFVSPEHLYSTALDCLSGIVCYQR